MFILTLEFFEEDSPYCLVSPATLMTILTDGPLRVPSFPLGDFSDLLGLFGKSRPLVLSVYPFFFFLFVSLTSSSASLSFLAFIFLLHLDLIQPYTSKERWKIPINERRVLFLPRPLTFSLSFSVSFRHLHFTLLSFSTPGLCLWVGDSSFLPSGLLFALLLGSPRRVSN